MVNIHETAVQHDDAIFEKSAFVWSWSRVVSHGPITGEPIRERVPSVTPSLLPIPDPTLLTLSQPPFLPRFPFKPRQQSPTLKIFLATETTNSNGVYRANPEPILVTTHPVPPRLLDARARAADASSSALILTVSLSSLAEVHYAVFQIPTTTTPREGNDGRGGLDEPTIESSSSATPVGGRERLDGRDDQEGGAGYLRDLGCGRNSVMVGGRREPVALNDTTGLVTSGVVSSATTSDSLNMESAEKRASTIPAGVPPAAGVPATSTPLGATGRSGLLAASRSVDGDALEVMFRVEGLQAAQAYSICLFTETPGSNGYDHIQ